jgi:hypothetical protein
MAVALICPSCSCQLSLPEDAADKPLACPRCGKPVSPSGPGGTAAGERPAAAPESAAGPAAGEYECPFCGSGNRWQWRRNWTPASTVALLLMLPLACAAVWWVGREVLYASGFNHYLDNRPWTQLFVGAAGGLLVFVLFFVLTWRLLFESRQVCPDCGMRLG